MNRKIRPDRVILKPSGNSGTFFASFAHQRSRILERPHDLDVDMDGALALQHTQEHGHTLFGEDVGKIFPVLAAPRLQGHKL